MKKIIVKYFQPAILFVLTLTIASIFSALGIDPLHQGIMLKPAIDVAHGQMLFRDTFTQYGALVTLLQAWSLRIFGDYLIVIQIETAIFYALISLCLYYLWLNILPRWLTTISVIIWLFIAPYYLMPFNPWSSVYALFFQLLSLILVLHALRIQSQLMIMLAGGVAILTFWCRQPVGVFHCVSLVFFLATTPLITGQPWKKAMRDCAFFIAGTVLASAPFLVWLALNGAIHDMYLQSIKAAFFFGVNTSSSDNLFIGALRSLFIYKQRSSDFSFLWKLLPIICLLLLAMLALKRWRNRESVDDHLPLYGLLLVSLASWMQYYPVSCIRHCYWAATPMIGLFSYFTWHLFSFKKRNIQILIVCLILASVFGYYMAERIYHGFEKITIYKKKIEEPKVLRGMHDTVKNAAYYRTISISLNDAIKKNPFPYLVNLTWNPLYLTFIGPQKNFHPMHGALEGWNSVYPDFKKIQHEFIYTKHPLVLWYMGVDFPGWTCVEAYKTTESAYYLAANNIFQLALYHYFPGDNKTH